MVFVSRHIFDFSFAHSLSLGISRFPIRIRDLQHLNAVLYKDLIHEIEFRICLHPLRHFNCGPSQMRQAL